MDVRPVVVPIAQLVLAACVGTLAVLGMFSTDPAIAGALIDPYPASGWFLVLPLTGIVAFGLFDWQAGRGPGILRAGNVAVFAFAVVELSMGTTGFARWLTGAIAIAAATGLAASIIITPPHRAGFRR
jgi:hypothetical protein